MKMKKLLVLLASLAMVTACSGSSSGGTSGGTTPTPTPEPEPEPEPGPGPEPTPVPSWSDDVQKIFDDHFGGASLPYFESEELGLGELEFAWSEEDGALVINGGEISSPSELKGIAESFKELGFIDTDAEEDDDPDEASRRALRNLDEDDGDEDPEEPIGEAPYFPAAEIAEFFGSTDVVPEFTSETLEDIYYDYDEEYEEFEIDFVVGDGNEEVSKEAYAELFLAAGWTGEQDSYGDWTFISPNDELSAYLWIWESYYPGEMILDLERAPVPAFSFMYETEVDGVPHFLFADFTSVVEIEDEDDGNYYVAAIPGEFLMYVYEIYSYEFPTEELAAFYADFYVNDFEVPALNASYYYAAEDPYNILYIMFDMPEYVNYTVDAYGVDEDGFYAYLDALEDAGWVVLLDEEEPTAGIVTMEYGPDSVTGLSGELVFTVEFYEGLGVELVFYPYCEDLIPFEPAEFPAEVNEDLAAAGCTDTLPAFTGAAEEYSYYSQGGRRQLAIIVKGSEAEAIATYQADLLAAGYTEAGVDSYGDMHYTSPNGEIDVCAWNGADIDYAGYIFVDIELNIEEEITWTPEEAVSHVASYFNGTVTEIDDGLFYTGGMFYASSYSVEDMKYYTENLFVPAGFELVVDWTADEFEDGTACEYCIYLCGDTVLEFVVYSDVYQETTDVTCLDVYAWTAEAE